MAWADSCCPSLPRSVAPLPSADGIQAATDLQRFSQQEMEQLFELRPAAAAQLAQWCRGVDETAVQARHWGGLAQAAECAACLACGEESGEGRAALMGITHTGSLLRPAPPSPGEAASQDAVSPDGSHTPAAVHAPLPRRPCCGVSIRRPRG